MTGPAAPLKKVLLVRRIYQLDAYTLGIEWIDGHKSRWRLSHLRRNCPCAYCRHEMTGERLLNPGSVDENIQATIIRSVGRYALNIAFSDGHDTGIFAFDYLRGLCQCDECSGGSSEPTKD